MDPTLKYALTSTLQREQLNIEEQIEEAREAKKLRELAKDEARQRRIKERMEELRLRTLVGGPLPKSRQRG